MLNVTYGFIIQALFWDRENLRRGDITAEDIIRRVERPIGKSRGWTPTVLTIQQAQSMLDNWDKYIQID